MLVLLLLVLLVLVLLLLVLLLLLLLLGCKKRNFGGGPPWGAPQDSSENSLAARGPFLVHDKKCKSFYSRGIRRNSSDPKP